VLEALEQIGVSMPIAAVVNGLQSVKWPGRLDRRSLPDGLEMLLDAAHNRDGAAALARFLLTSQSTPRPLVFAAMQDKDVTGMLRELLPAVGALVVTRASHARSSDPGRVADIARALAPALRILVEPSLGDALDAAWRISPTIVIAGSIFLIGDVIGLVDET
jgi:dihydrofolate synthase/folylpolyglutamate synthase